MGELVAFTASYFLIVISTSAAVCDLISHASASSPLTGPRFGSALAHGEAHTADHARWSRRDFMATMGLTGGGLVMAAGTPIRAFGQTNLLQQLRLLETNRVLVLIQLSGGNDGLNTVVPITDDRYYTARPSLAVQAREALSVDGQTDLGFHPSFSSLTPLYGDGEMAVLHSVGYEDPSLSHFRATDIWLSASDSDEVVETGWAGRYLDAAFPDTEAEPLTFPLAVQVGGLSSMLFRGPSANLGMSLASPDIFERIAEDGLLYRIDDLPDTTYGDEMRFVRTVANDAFTYAEAVQDAAQLGTTRVEYPTPNPLSRNLAITAQLIKGRLGARIYHVTLGGFDTHAQQAGTHGTLLRYLAEAVRAFLADLEADGAAERVLVMTYSEFGRRVQENGSRGTDHGTAAPLFLFGRGVAGGFYGSLPDLGSLDATGNPPFQTDFRQVYATMLTDWFGLPPGEAQTILGQPYASLGFVADPAAPTLTEPVVPHAFKLQANYPNPFNQQTTIAYALDAAMPVMLQVFDVQGRHVQTLVQANQAPGLYTVRFDARHLPSGTYFYRLDAAGTNRTRTMTLAR